MPVIGGVICPSTAGSGIGSGSGIGRGFGRCLGVCGQRRRSIGPRCDLATVVIHGRRDRHLDVGGQSFVGRLSSVGGDGSRDVVDGVVSATVRVNLSTIDIGIGIGIDIGIGISAGAPLTRLVIIVLGKEMRLLDDGIIEQGIGTECFGRQAVLISQQGVITVGSFGAAIDLAVKQRVLFVTLARQQMLYRKGVVRRIKHPVRQPVLPFRHTLA